MNRENGSFFMGMVALAAGIALAAWFLAGSVRDIKRGEDTISSTGSATKAIKSDFIIWRGRVTAQGATAQAAFPALRGHVDSLKGYFSKNGVEDKELTWQSVTVSPLYQTRVLENEQTVSDVVGYELSQAFGVESTDVDRVTRVSQQVTDLLEDGVPMESYPPEYYYTKLEEMRVEMLGLATEDAKRRAAMMAESAGGKVGALRSISSGVFQITPRYSTDVSGYGINDTTALDKDITAVVKATFAAK